MTHHTTANDADVQNASANDTTAFDVSPLASCPRCEGRDFLVEDEPDVIFRCLGCTAGWRVHLGYAWAVDPLGGDVDLIGGQR